MMALVAAWYDFDPFHSLYNWLRDNTSSDLVYVVIAVIGATGILSFVGLGALANVWLERRIIGRIQVRRGPNRVGPFGLLQPVADAIKLIQKEVLQPSASDAKLFNLPPILVFIPAMLTFAVFAWAPDMVYADLNVGVLYILALSSITSLAIFMAGWSSNNKYALLGAMRVIAMAISYEIPLVLALLAPVLFAGTMSIPGLVDFQKDQHVWLAFLLPLPVFIYAIAATAELNRTPADIAEAESEIVAGFHTEYSGMKFGLFYAVELINSLAVSGIMASLFFGGYSIYRPGGLHPAVDHFHRQDLLLLLRPDLASRHLASPAHRSAHGLRLEDADPAGPDQRGRGRHRGPALASAGADGLDTRRLRGDQRCPGDWPARLLLPHDHARLLPSAAARATGARHLGAVVAGAGAFDVAGGARRGGGVMDSLPVIIAFYVLAAITLISALMVAMVRDLVHAVLFLILSFIGIAGLYLTLSADFVAVVQILIYAGAISVLMLFAILLTPRSARDNAAVSYSAPISVIAGLLGADHRLRSAKDGLADGEWRPLRHRRRRPSARRCSTRLCCRSRWRPSSSWWR